jgi:hypothetical protein
VLEVSGTENLAELGRRHREKVVQALDNTYGWGAWRETGMQGNRDMQNCTGNPACPQFCLHDPCRLVRQVKQFGKLAFRAPARATPAGLSGR